MARSSQRNRIHTGIHSSDVGQNPMDASFGAPAGMWRDFQPWKLLNGKYIKQGVSDGNHDTRQWLVTRVEAGAGESTLTVGQTCPPTLIITTDANESDGINAQWQGCQNDDGSTLAVQEAFKFTAGSHIWFECRVKADAVTQTKGEIGLCITDTTINGGVSDGMYFRKKDGDDTWFFVLEKNSTETETELTTALGSTEWVDDTYVKLGFHLRCGATAAASSIEVYVNDVKIRTAIAMTNLCDDEELALSHALYAGEANDKIFTFSHIVAYQEVLA